MRWSLLLGVLVSAFAPPVAACIHTIGTDRPWHRFVMMLEAGDELIDAMRGYRAHAHRLAAAPNVIAAACPSLHLEQLTDLAIVLTYQGRHADAIALLLRIEHRDPGHAETAVNLGTALELPGYDRVALRCTGSGSACAAIPPNTAAPSGCTRASLPPNSPSACILGYLATQSIAGLAFDPILVPATPSPRPADDGGKPVTSADLNLALLYQLSERMNFVTEPDRATQSRRQPARNLRQSQRARARLRCTRDCAERAAPRPHSHRAGAGGRTARLRLRHLPLTTMTTDRGLGLGRASWRRDRRAAAAAPR